jgi:hypothetical protein
VSSPMRGARRPTRHGTSDTHLLVHR